MSGFATAFVIVNGLVLLLVPRRWAPLPFLIGACYMTLGQGLDLGPFTFTVLRLLVAVGFVRVVIRQEGLVGGMTILDWTILFFGFSAVLSSPFHQDPSSALVYRLGIFYNICGIYFLFRIFFESAKNALHMVAIIAILLVPVAAEMVIEVNTLQNHFSKFGGVPPTPHIREGKVRAQGPFTHAILAGTVGAVTLPLMFGIWRQHRYLAVLGILASLTIVVSAGSSGPYLTSMAAIGALCMWRFRARMRFFRWLIVLTYIGLDIVMKAPAYYIIARVPIVQGSTGYHRAYIIESAIRHIDEWFLAGTDYTAHWMVTGVSWSPDHTDITNYYVHWGIVGGLPLMLLFIFALSRGFAFVGRAIRDENLPEETAFGIWALGASLFAHTVTSISVSYFDQSFVFVYITLASIGSAWASLASSKAKAAVSTPAFESAEGMLPLEPKRSF